MRSSVQMGDADQRNLGVKQPLAGSRTDSGTESRQRPRMLLRRWTWWVLTALWLGLVMSVNLPGQPASNIPSLPARLRPGQDAPEGLSCSFYEPDFAHRDCQAGDDVYVE